MPDIQPAVVFPAASTKGGVERIALETLRHLAPRHTTTFVGYDLEGVGELAPIRHVTPRRPVWGRGALSAAAFRSSAAACLADQSSTISISYGVNAPPGDVYIVNSVHRAWLERGQPITLSGVQIPAAARYLLPRHQVLLALEWDYFRRHEARRVIVVSDAVASDLSRLYGLKPAAMEVIPNGFDPQQCSAERRVRLRAERRTELGISADAVVVLFVGNELHRKGLDVLLEATARHGGDPFEIHVVGRTPLTDYGTRIAALGLTDRVRYHGATDDIGLFHAAADLLVLPTQYEAFALTIVEALASGLPVITTVVPGAGDRIHHGENGLLQQDPLNAEELQTLLELALDPTRRHEWALNAPGSVADLDWTSLMARVERVSW